MALQRQAPPLPGIPHDECCFGTSVTGTVPRRIAGADAPLDLQGPPQPLASPPLVLLGPPHARSAPLQVQQIHPHEEILQA